jgi:hypothetical protein
LRLFQEHDQQHLKLLPHHVVREVRDVALVRALLQVRPLRALNVNQ